MVMLSHLQVYRPTHPKANRSGCIWAHVEVAEQALGQLLPAGVEVHHVDGNPRNNAPRNLVICQDRAFHKLLHARARIVRAGGNPNTEKICATCQAVLPLSAFNRNQTQCRVCSHAYTKTYRRPCRA